MAARTGLTISSMPPSTTSFHHLPAGRPSSTFTVCDVVLGWQTIPGQWPWKTAACALLPAHSSIIFSSQLVPLSFSSCCPGISQDTKYCAAATGLLRPEVDSRVDWEGKFTLHTGVGEHQEEDIVISFKEKGQRTRKSTKIFQRENLLEPWISLQLQRRNLIKKGIKKIILGAKQ